MKFAKVMFLQVSVCPQGGMHGGGACMAGGMHGRGACMVGGCVWQGGIQGASMARGHPWQRGMHGRAGHAWWYSQWAGSTHPTGIHSCYILNFWLLSIKKATEVFTDTDQLHKIGHLTCSPNMFSRTLLAFLGSCIHGNYDANQSLLVLNFTEELHTRPYMVTKRRCVWNTTFPFRLVNQWWSVLWVQVPLEATLFFLRHLDANFVQKWQKCQICVIDWAISCFISQLS